jgi:hypothetical protein
MRLASLIFVLAGCPAVAPTPNLPVSPPAYPPQIAQITAARHAEIVRELSAPYQIANANIDAFGDIELHSWDPALLEQRQDHGAFSTHDITRLEKLVSDHAKLFHVAGAVHFTVNGPDLQLDQTTPEGTTHIAITRSWDESSDNHVWMLLDASFRRTLPAMPDTTKAADALRARLVGAEFDRIVHMQQPPCDPVGPVDTCPRDREQRTRLTIARDQVVVATGPLQLIRGPGKPLETHAVVCATLAAEPAKPDASEGFIGTTVTLEPVDPKLHLPLVVDAITGEDLTAQVHAHGSVGCGVQITGNSYDANQLEQGT